MTSQLFDLTGRVAAISGAASGMGRAACLALAEHGADIVLFDLNADGAEATAGEIRALGRRALPVICNVSEPDRIREAFATIDREFGRIDFLANIAGEGLRVSPEDITQEQLLRVFQNLVFGRFCMCQEAGRRMLAAGKGSILNIGSIASVSALGRNHIAYSMAMGAVVQMTRELSTEWASRGVRVNAVLPAQTMNPDLAKRIGANPAMEAKWLSGIPRGRFGDPSDFQGLAVLLASDASSWITGAIIPMDGGNLAMNAGGTIGGVGVAG
ncbi:SDR family NAD(P)-dependent oxidoreductase [Planctellipticum variicoloris]|uniref:SDR family NAD(P)-dependent oxidoreductase n=1 Tax=Planctellipticum variicoloris TaxID=3064265 RepID=UPI0030141579|nr:SDR family oxidoreductase [Planctomycetaceae bacterium SH412]